ncbi:MAG: hypothetical protein ACK5N0_08405 [Synechococcaceae cyanobacterium]
MGLFFLATVGHDLFLGHPNDLTDTVSYAAPSSTQAGKGVKVNLLLTGPQPTVGSGMDTFSDGKIGFQRSGADLFLVGNTSGSIDFRVLLQHAARDGLSVANIVL